MGIFDRTRGNAPSPAGGSDDEQAIARYRYMLKTAPPETLEQAHAEAFARLTPGQRQRVLEELRAAMPDAERNALVPVADPQALARYATRAEIRQPGTLERTFGAMPVRPGLGSLLAGSFLGSMAGTVLGTMIAQQFLGHAAMEAGGFDHRQAMEGSTGDSPIDYADDDSGGDLGTGDTFDI